MTSPNEDKSGLRSAVAVVLPSLGLLRCSYLLDGANDYLSCMTMRCVSTERRPEELQDLEKGVVRWVKVLLRVLWFNFM